MCGCNASLATECIRTHSRSVGPLLDRPAREGFVWTSARRPVMLEYWGFEPHVHLCMARHVSLSKLCSAYGFCGH